MRSWHWLLVGMVVVVGVYWAGSRSCRCPEVGSQEDGLDSLRMERAVLVEELRHERERSAMLKAAVDSAVAGREVVIKWLPHVEKELHSAGFDAQCERMLRSVEW